MLLSHRIADFLFLSEAKTEKKLCYFKKKKKREKCSECSDELSIKPAKTPKTRCTTVPASLAILILWLDDVRARVFVSCSICTVLIHAVALSVPKDVNDPECAALQCIDLTCEVAFVCKQRSRALRDALPPPSPLRSEYKRASFYLSN